MGGEVFVGVRLEKLNGKGWSEYLSLRWTNPMPWYMANLDFYNKGKVLFDFLGDAKPDNDWPESKSTKVIEPSEYGVILFDFKDKIVFSRQRYSGPGSYNCYQPNEHDEKVLTPLIKNGLITKATDIDWKQFDVPKSFVELVRANCFTVDYKIPDWTFDHKSEVGREVWPEVLDWLKTHQWKSKVQSMRKVQRERSIGLIGVKGTLKFKVE